MPWSYSGNPASSALDQVRFLVGDTDTTDQLLLDAEITSLITEYPNPYLAGAACCEQLAAKFSREVNKSIGHLSVSAGERAKAYLVLAKTLRKRSRAKGLVPYIGGRSQSDKIADAQDADAVQPNFRIGQDDLPPVNPFDPRYKQGNGF